MKIINASYNIQALIAGGTLLKMIETIGRTCYKSEEKMTPDSSSAFVKNIIKRGHESVLEHQSVSVRIICDRGVSHELVRHRIASYSQESTRYCNYASGKFNGELTFIKPCFAWSVDTHDIWYYAMCEAEKAYKQLIEDGASPQEARSVLPNSLKTEIVVTMNLREWRHFFRLRCASSAHPQMREITIPMLVDFKKLIPIVFDDINPV